jgi:hypothetical protein
MADDVTLNATGASEPPISEEDGMPFEPGHKRVAGRKAGTPNKLSGEAREVARRLLSAEYQRSLQKRLIRGEAPRVELHLWLLAFGRPPVESAEAPEGAGASAGLAQILERLGEPPKTQNSSSHLSASPGTDQRDTEEELT